MGLISTGTTVEMKVYLTELGRRRLLEQGFLPTSFSVSDDDVNYLANENLNQVSSDVTGDNTTNVNTISVDLKLKNQILR